MTMLAWLDLETTGIDDTRDRILEIAWQVTTTALEPVTAVRTHVVQIPTEAWDLLDEERNAVAKQMHRDSGLEQALIKGRWALRLDVLEATILDDLSMFAHGETVQLAGASVHFDKLFLRQWMPTLHERLHHRVYDTSTLKTFFEEQGIQHGVENEGPHRAANDVREVLAVAQAYRTWVSTMKAAVRIMASHEEL